MANNPSLFNGDTIANNFTQPAALPAYQMAAINHLNATHPGTRVFAIPGNDFAAYRWGDTVDTPQPAFLDRDFVTREQQIMGSIATADTLYAIDDPMQDGIANCNALAPMARLMGAGDVMVEYDQQLRALRHAPAPAAGPAAGADAAGADRPGVVRHAAARTRRPCRRSNEQDLAVPGNPRWPSPIVTYTVRRSPPAGPRPSPTRGPWSWRATPPD